MPVFKFRLQTFLNLKEQFEKNARNELGLAVKKLEEEKSKLYSIMQQTDLEAEAFKKACTGAIRPEKIKEHKYYLEHLKKEAQRQEANVKKQQQNVDKIRERLVEIMRERKVLENLKEKEFQEYKKQEEMQEQLRVDELVSYKEAAKVDRTG